MSISAFERLSNEETHCKLAISAILKSLTKLFIQNQTCTMHQEEILLQICTFAENRILSRILAFWLIRRPPWSWKNQGELIFHWEDGPLGAKNAHIEEETCQLSRGTFQNFFRSLLWPECTNLVTNSIIFDTYYSTCSGFYNFLTQQN